MNFYKYVIKKYKNEDSPYGDLALDMLRDKQIKNMKDDDEIFYYLDCFPDIQEFYMELKSEYTDTVLKEKAIKKFGYIETEYGPREELKILSEKLNYLDLKIFSHWSRSVVSNKYNLKHPSFQEYKKHYQVGDVDWLPMGRSIVDMELYLNK